MCGGGSEAAGGASRLFGGGAGGEFGASLAELFWWAASPAPAARPLQPRLLRALYHAPAPALRFLAPKYKDPSALRKVRNLPNIHRDDIIFSRSGTLDRQKFHKVYRWSSLHGELHKSHQTVITSQVIQ